MGILCLVLLILAALCFVAASIGIPSRVSLIPLGLAFCVIEVILVNHR